MAPTTDPYAELRALVPDPLTYRVLVGLCGEHRRRPGSTLEAALAAVVMQVKGGGIADLVEQGRKPAALVQEEYALADAVRAALASLSGRDTGEPAFLRDLKAAVAGVLAARYRHHPPRSISRAVAMHVGRSRHIGRGIEVRTAAMAAMLSGIRG